MLIMSKIMAEAGGSPIQWKSGLPDTMEKLGSIPRTPTRKVLAAQQDQACRGSAHRAPEIGKSRSASAHLAPQTAARRRPLSSSSTLLPRRRERRKWERSDVKEKEAAEMWLQEGRGPESGGAKPHPLPHFFLFIFGGGECSEPRTHVMSNENKFPLTQGPI
jgi:hypothetical protein